MQLSSRFRTPTHQLPLASKCAPAGAQSRASHLSLEISNIRRCSLSLPGAYSWAALGLGCAQRKGQVECEACGSPVNCSVQSPKLQILFTKLVAKKQAIGKWHSTSQPTSHRGQSTLLPYLLDLFCGLLMRTLAAFKSLAESGDPTAISLLRYGQSRSASPDATPTATQIRSHQRARNEPFELRRGPAVGVGILAIFVACVAYKATFVDSLPIAFTRLVRKPDINWYMAKVLALKTVYGVSSNKKLRNQHEIG